MLKNTVSGFGVWLDTYSNSLVDEGLDALFRAHVDLDGGSFTASIADLLGDSGDCRFLGLGVGVLGDGLGRV